MNNRSFHLAILFIVLVINAYPLYQMSSTQGVLYFLNAYDESIYLQYDYSRLDGNLSRPTQFIVTLAHRAGLSGGWINLIFDTLCLVFFPVVLRKIFLQLNFRENDANALSILAVLLPTFFGGLNPVISRLFYRSLEHGWLYWVSLPEAWYLPIIRSPEPQLSLVALSAALLIALRIKRYWPIYLCAPFLYSYVTIPLLFIAFALQFRSFWGDRPYGKWFAPLASFGAICLLLWLNISFALSPVKKEMFVASRLPILSFAAVSALSIYFVFRKGINQRFRYVALLAALMPLFLLNQQVLTGWFFHTTNYEQNSGVLCAVLVSLFAIGGSMKLQRAALVLSLMFLADLGWVIFNSNHSINRKLELTPALKEALRRDPSRVAVNDVGLSSRLTMVFPGEALTFFAYEQIFPALAPFHFKEYSCGKSEILKDASVKDKFKGVFDQLDRAYRHTGNDFVLIHSGRKKEFAVKYETDIEPVDCGPSRLSFFLVDE